MCVLLSIMKSLTGTVIVKYLKRGHNTVIQPGLEFALLDQESSALNIRSPSLPCQHIQLGNIEQSDHNAIPETNFVGEYF